MILTVFFAGLFLGSFLAVLGWRLPRRRPVVWDRSRCDRCHNVLQWYELIPILSYILQRGRCRKCGVRLSLLYPVSEIACGIGLAVLFWHFGFSLSFLFASIALVAALVLCVSDILYQVLPDGVMAIFGVGIAAFVFLQPEPTITSRLLTAGLSAGFFGLLYFFTRGRGMGLGDVKLAFVLGFLLDYPGMIVALYAAFLTGAAVGVILILGRYLKLKSRIAFGPFLFLGTVITLLCGDTLIAFWREVLL